jgi:hypothetical protein
MNRQASPHRASYYCGLIRSIHNRDVIPCPAYPFKTRDRERVYVCGLFTGFSNGPGQEISGRPLARSVYLVSLVDCPDRVAGPPFEVNIACIPQSVVPSRWNS